MFKHAWRSYLASIHPRNHKYIKNGALLGCWMYWFVISPIIYVFDDNGERAEQIWFYAVNLTPYVMMWWSNLEHKLSMPNDVSFTNAGTAKKRICRMSHYYQDWLSNIGRSDTTYHSWIYIWASSISNFGMCDSNDFLWHWRVCV